MKDKDEYLSGDLTPEMIQQAVDSIKNGEGLYTPYPTCLVSPN
jgi:hypothetical protein